MRIKALASVALLAAAPVVAQTAAMSSTDPYLWLEDKDGARPLAWVAAENALTLPRLQGDPRYAGFFRDALAIASASDRIPTPDLTNGRVLNFWRDREHPQGLWRWDDGRRNYATATPRWTTLIDLDALGRAEGKKWVWKGASCLQPDERLCLVNLSEGGEDAVTVREFDLQTGQFVAGGFTLPKAKQDVTWQDADTILVSRDWGAGDDDRVGLSVRAQAAEARSGCGAGGRGVPGSGERSGVDRRLCAARRGRGARRPSSIAASPFSARRRCC